MIAVRNILLWLALLLIQLHAVIPHKHRIIEDTKEVYLFLPITGKDSKDLYTFLIQIFSFDIGENHLDHFKCEKSDLFTPEFSEFIGIYDWYVEPFFLDLVSIHAKSYFIIFPHKSPVDPYSFRGPPALI